MSTFESPFSFAQPIIHSNNCVVCLNVATAICLQCGERFCSADFDTHATEIECVTCVKNLCDGLFVGSRCYKCAKIASEKIETRVDSVQRYSRQIKR